MAGKNPACHFQLEPALAYGQIPLKALPDAAREILCNALNKFLIISTKGGIERNFEGLAQLAGLQDELQELQTSPNPTEELLKKWEEEQEATIGMLMDNLTEMERYDVIEDLVTVLGIHQPELLPFVVPEEIPSTEEEDEEGILIDPKRFGLKVVPRTTWKARKAKEGSLLTEMPVRVVFIHHTVFYMEDPFEAMMNLQAKTIILYGYDDLSYNFVISNDGTVFVGRGWDRRGAHTSGYNQISISICFLGNYEEYIPTEEMLASAQKLIDYGVAINKIHPEYGLYCHCDASNTASPGKHVIERIKQWPRYYALGDLIALKTENARAKMIHDANAASDPNIN